MVRRVVSVIVLLLLLVSGANAYNRIGVIIVPPWYYEDDFQKLKDKETYHLFEKIRRSIYFLIRNTSIPVAKELRKRIKIIPYIPPGAKKKLGLFYKALIDGGECNGNEVFDADYLKCISLQKNGRIVIYAQFFINDEGGRKYLMIALQVYNFTNNVINTKSIQYPVDEIMNKINELDREIKKNVREALREALYAESVGQSYAEDSSMGGSGAVQGF